ncbi:MAG: DGQHR domain-containing protein [Chloroflexi bacterium]|nr:DGQHR domain-containing protein [Chloroflexota bacterium]
MLSNVGPVDSYRGLARAKAREYVTKTVSRPQVEELVAAGWKQQQQGKKSVRLIRPKTHGVHLEDRVWTLLYRMGFTHLSGAGGAQLLVNPKDADGPKTQVDVVGIDDEVAIAVEAKSCEKAARRPQFQEELGKFNLIRPRFAQCVHESFATPVKRQVVLAMFTSNVILSDNDKKRAHEAQVILFDQHDLAYYENLAAHIGAAARYQFLADMLPGKPVAGLALRVPAVWSRMGGYNCYTFSISPEYLLKISYVSHRSKGKASDVNTYQRMLARSRLKKIRQYIAGDGIFPTNIVVNLDKKRLRFEKVKQEGGSDGGVLGWLDLRPAYKSAWIIDGQHRLFAYSGDQRAHDGRLLVLAFEGLPPSKQAELFIDINAEQKSVKQSLLQELYSELHWDADEAAIRVRAIVSKAILALDDDPESPFRGRVLTADAARDATRCISLGNLYRALERPGFYIVKEKQGHILEYGPLWGGDNLATLRRTVHVMTGWFSAIRGAAPDWWDMGSGVGGGLAMNDGIAASVNVLRSVFQHLDANGRKLIHLDDDDLVGAVRPYAEAVGQYCASLSPDGRRMFRDLRGIQGQTTRTRRFQQAIHERFQSFDPPELKEFLEFEKAQTSSKAREIIDRIERTLQATIVEELKREFGPDDGQWWTLGVPKAVRLKVIQRHEEDDAQRGGKECYFDLIDYRTIVMENWNVFGDVLGSGKKNASKAARTAWIAHINEVRKVVSHASASVAVSLEQLAEIEGYDSWLAKRIAGEQGESEQSA